jgi:DNA-binding response OmpR family regulator
MVLEKIKILIVEDDVQILQMMQSMLEFEGYAVLTAGTGELGLQLLNIEKPVVILLDIMLPDLDGYTICRQIRRFSKIPIIMVTAKVDVNERVEGLNAGADDYITKPFSFSELMARINAVLRRVTFPEGTPVESCYEYQDLKIDFFNQLVTVKGVPVDLTVTEYRVLTILALRAGTPVSPESILTEVWGEGYSHATHMLQVNVSRLRQKLHDCNRRNKYIETMTGKGYILNG